MARANQQNPSLLAASPLAAFLDPNDQRGTFKAIPSLTELLQAIQYDLTCLLNHKRILINNNYHDKNLTDSILYYGLPDLSVYNPLSEHDRRTVCTLLQQTISNFEKRLTDIRVIDEAERHHMPSLTMHFRIQATLALATESVTVRFASIVQNASDQVVIHQDNHYST